MMGIRYPIIGAPMFLVSYEELVVAVCNAGGLGMLPLPNYRTTEQLRQAMEIIRSQTEAPVGVNIHLSGKFPWQEQLSVCLDYGVKFFITSLGDPRLILDAVHARGGLVFADVVSLAQAFKAREGGLDGLVAVGAGAGGHGGRVSTMILVPYLSEKVGLPVIAAGGISTGAQMAAAIACGACAVIVGTRFVATTESRASGAYKQALIDADPDGIICTDRVTGNPANWIAASIADMAERPPLTSKKWRDFWSAGQSVAQIQDIKPAAQIVAEMVAEYCATCRRLPGTLVSDEL
ncbi:MAG: 2-nitropropane dioxygenase [Deltaproteobacteria bacterium HGW-Deltaproteobacteria-12]|nr:MAG: 2-nitropropane dioxygenase [Deltaproteobacteria bacterium HGW-Deltaproteobacteria-12]